MASLADINIKFSADLKAFSTAMQNSERQIKKMGRSLKKVGTNLTIGVTAPLLAIGAAGVKAWDEQEKAIAQVNAGLEATAGAVGFTSEQLQKMAEDLQNNTLFGDEKILKDATAQLLTFTNIANEQFARTQQAALDLATRLDGDLKSASIQLGKALNDPVANLSALSRSGIQFSTEQKKVIKALVETNRLADAQTIILDELERQYGGSAEAAAKAGLGPFQQLGNILGDLTEDFGKLIAEALLPFIEKIKGVAEKIKSLPPETKKLIAVIAALVAAIGPLLLGLGFLMTNVIPGLITAFGFLKGATIAATTSFKSLTAAMLANPVALIAAGVAALVFAFTTLIQKITPAVSKLQTFFNLVKSGGDIGKFATLQTLDQAQAMEDEAKAQDEANKVIEKTNALLGEYSSKLKEISTIPSPSVASKKSTEAVSGESTGVDVLPVTGFEQTFENFGLSSAQVQEQEDFAERLIESQERLKATAIGVGDGVANAFAGMSNSFIDSLGLADSGLQGFAKSLAKTITQIIAQLLSEAIAFAIVGGAQSGAATGPGAIVAIPTMIATLIGGVFAAFAAIPGFADGGIVSGPTLALVGEYPGASSNPEVIAPLDKLKDLIEPQGGITDVVVHGVFEVDGRKLKLVLDRTNQQLNRLS